MTTIKNLNKWVKEFRKSRKSISHGYPLWAYKINDKELLELQTLMSELVDSQTLRKVINLHERYYSEAFVLFAATWLQRNSFGRTKWGPVLAAVRASGMDQADRSSLVDRGLRQWGLSVYSTETSARYLDSLTCQGGFPRSNLLQQSGSHIMEYFEAVLTRFERYQHAESLEELAIECLSHLPITLQQNAFAVLVTQLIECLLEWKAYYDLGAYKDAVKVLDNTNSTWRQELPFLVLDEEAQTLINKLLKRASQFKRRELNPIRVKRQLVPAGDDYRLTADLYIAREIHMEDLARQLGEQTLPKFFVLSTQTCDDNQFRTASFTLKNGANRGWQVSSYHTSVKNTVAAGELSFSIDSDGRQVLASTYYRGEALEPSAPWIFEPSGSTLKYIGQGCIKSNKDRLFIVSQSLPIKTNAISSVKESGALIGSELRVFEITGEVEVEGLSGRYRISCNSGESEEFKVSIVTPEYIDLSSKHPVYRGVPAVTLTQKGDTEAIPENELYWYKKASKTLDPFAKGSALGGGVLVWKKDLNVLWEKQCVILPEHFDYRLNHVQEGKFSLILRNAQKPMFGMLAGYENWIVHSPNYDASDIRTDILPKDAAAETFGISLKWNKDRDTECELVVPISFNAATLVDRKGQNYRELERGGLTFNELSNLQVALRTNEEIDELDSISMVANLYGPPGSNGRESFLMARQVNVEVECKNSTNIIRGRDLSALAGKLFKHADQLDSYLKVAFYVKGQEIPNSLPRITRYKNDPTFVDNATAFTLLPTPTLLSVESPMLYMSPIWDFNQDPIELIPEDKSANVWRFVLPEPKDVEYGSWLIWADSELSVHPRIKHYAIPRQEQDPSELGLLGTQLLAAMVETADTTNIYKERLKPGTLTHKVKYLNPDDYESMNSLNKTIRNMGFDINHPGWGYIDGVMKRIESLEPLALYTMTAMQRNPGALVVLLFRNKQRFNESWELAERLGMSWYAISPKIWISVLQQYFEKVKKDAEPLREVSEETYWGVVYCSFEAFEAKGSYFKYLVDLATDRPTFEPVAIWEDDELKRHGLDDQTVGAFFRRERTALLDRHEGKLLSRIGTKKTTTDFIDMLEKFWPTHELPRALDGFIKYTEAEQSDYRTKQDAWTLTMGLPLKLGFCLSGFYKMPRNSKFVMQMRSVLSLIDESDREWLQNAFIIARMACELVELEQSIHNTTQNPETIA